MLNLNNSTTSNSTENNSLDNLSNNNNNKSPLIHDYNGGGLIQIGSPSSMLHHQIHHTHNLSAPLSSATATSPSAASAQSMLSHHQHHPLIYHPPNPNDWYHTGPTGATAADSMTALNHFGHHHHHHLVHHGPTTAYWEPVNFVNNVNSNSFKILDEFYF